MGPQSATITNGQKIKFGSSTYTVFFNYNAQAPDLANVINGTSGNDYLIATQQQQTINAGRGDDLIDISSRCAEIFIDGGRGTDRVRFSWEDWRKLNLDYALGFSFDNNNHFTISYDGHSLHLSNVEYLQIGDLGYLLKAGTQRSDLIVGKSNEANLIAGMDGNDSIYGGNLDDIIHGGRGNDILYGFGGKNGLFGNEGNDTLYGGNDDDRIDGGAGNDSLIGGDGSDDLFGEGGSDFIDGGRGNDTIFSDGDPYGPDVDPNLDTDTVIGGDGRDKIYSDNGDVLIWGDAVGSKTRFSDEFHFQINDYARTIIINDFDTGKNGDRFSTNGDYSASEFFMRMQQKGSDTYFVDRTLTIIFKNVQKSSFTLDNYIWGADS